MAASNHIKYVVAQKSRATKMTSGLIRALHVAGAHKGKSTKGQKAAGIKVYLLKKSVLKSLSWPKSCT